MLEDLTKRVTPQMRLIAAAAAAVLASFLVNTSIDRLDVFGLDMLIKIPLISLALTAFAVAGIANTVNIIDGFNGLSSVVVCTMLLSLIYVAFSVHDVFVMSCALALLGAVLGFLCGITHQAVFSLVMAELT